MIRGIWRSGIPLRPYFSWILYDIGMWERWNRQTQLPRQSFCRLLLIASVVTFQLGLMIHNVSALLMKMFLLWLKSMKSRNCDRPFFAKNADHSTQFRCYLCSISINYSILILGTHIFRAIASKPENIIRDSDCIWVSRQFTPAKIGM